MTYEWKKQAKKRGISVGRCIGKGGTSKVFNARTKDNNDLVLKVVSHKTLGQMYHRTNGVTIIADRESNIMEKLQSMEVHNMVHIYDSFKAEASEGEKYSCILMEKGIPLNHFSRNHHFTEYEAWKLLQDLSHCLVDLHSANILHRDIKEANTFLRKKEKQAFLLGDFGTAVVEIIPTARTDYTIIGTPGYVAPEVLRGETCTKSDIYSLGQMTYHILTDEFLKVDDDMTHRQDVEQLLQEGYSKDLVDTISYMVNIRPENRPDAKKVYDIASEKLSILKEKAKILEREKRTLEEAKEHEICNEETNKKAKKRTSTRKRIMSSVLTICVVCALAFLIKSIGGGLSRTKDMEIKDLDTISQEYCLDQILDNPQIAIDSIVDQEPFIVDTANTSGDWEKVQGSINTLQYGKSIGDRTVSVGMDESNKEIQDFGAVDYFYNDGDSQEAMDAFIKLYQNLKQLLGKPKEIYIYKPDDTSYYYPKSSLNEIINSYNNTDYVYDISWNIHHKRIEIHYLAAGKNAAGMLFFYVYYLESY